MTRLLLILLALAGCSHRPSLPAQASRAALYYPLLPPASYGRAASIEQLLEGHYQDKHFRLHVFLEIDPKQMLVVGFTAFQTRAFVIRYDGRSVAFENFTDRKLPFPPHLIVSDIQQALWPTLPRRAGWRAVNDAAEQVRLVFFEHQLVTEIQYNETIPSSNRIVLSNLKYGYRLFIRTLTVQP